MGDVGLHISPLGKLCNEKSARILIMSQKEGGGGGFHTDWTISLHLLLGSSFISQSCHYRRKGSFPHPKAVTKEDVFAPYPQAVTKEDVFAPYPQAVTTFACVFYNSASLKRSS